MSNQFILEPSRYRIHNADIMEAFQELGHLYQAMRALQENTSKHVRAALLALDELYKSNPGIVADLEWIREDLVAAMKAIDPEYPLWSSPVDDREAE